MIISSRSFWLIGNPRQILAALAILVEQYQYVAEVVGRTDRPN